MDSNTENTKRAGLKGLMSAFEEKLNKVMVAVTDLTDGFEEMKEQIDLEEIDLEKMKEEIDDVKETLRDEFSSAMNQVTVPLKEKNEALEVAVEALKLEVQELKTELALCKSRIANGVGNVQAAHKVDVPRPRPKEFKGYRSANEAHNFIWSMEQYFGAIGIQDAKDKNAKVTIAFMFLTDVAVLWWCCDEMKRGANPIDTRDDFIKGFREQFFTDYAKDKSRGKLRGLTQTGTVPEYVKEFNELRHDIPHLGDSEALFAFMNGLKPWARSLLQRRGVQDISKAITVAESLLDFSKPRSFQPKIEGKRGEEPEKSGNEGPSKTIDGKWKETPRRAAQGLREEGDPI